MGEFAPGFELAGGLALTAARAISLAAILSAFGTLLFALVVAPPALAGAADDKATQVRLALRRLAAGSLAVAVPAILTWLVLQAGALTGRIGLAATRDVLVGTLFGHLAGAEIALAGGALLALAITRWPLVPAVPVTLSTLSLAGHSHAFAMDEGSSLLLACDVVHVLAAGAWLGGLPPLLIAVWKLPPSGGARAARHFSPLGKVCVVAILVTAAWQFWVLIGGLPGLFGTPYGWVAGLKLALFGALFGCAVLNRYGLAPALRGTRPEAARRALLVSISGQCGLGLTTLAAAAMLAALPPAMHEQAAWPFALRPNLATAYPTSYFRSPTGFSAAAISHGVTLYAGHCVVCHGLEGSGDGPAVAGLSVRPADLTGAHLLDHDDGTLFWWLSRGIDDPAGGAQRMPGFAGLLSAEDRWTLIDAIRARNAGAALRRLGGWPQPPRAPGFSARCGGRTLRFPETLGGSAALLTFGADPARVELFLVGDDLAATLCRAEGPEIAAAYAAVAGVRPTSLPGWQFLVDPTGWLRAAHGPNVAPDWTAPGAMRAAAAILTARPLAAPEASPAIHAH